MPPRSLIPMDAIDVTSVVADLEAIRKCNPQRYELEQLSWLQGEAEVEDRREARL